MDSVSKETRSRIMSHVRSENTKPEMAVRLFIYSLGYRYRLHVKMLPGKPDIVLRKIKKVIFVNGCFWHQHSGCKNNRPPKSNLSFWLPKLKANVKHDKIVSLQLKKQGWKVLVIWECETQKMERIKSRIRRFLGK